MPTEDEARAGASPAAASGAANAGGETAATDLDPVRAVFDGFNEVVQTDGDVLAWVKRNFDAQAAYRPIEESEWACGPDAIRRSVVRWIETWGPGTHRIEPVEILEAGDERLLVSAHNRGVGRGSGVPIEAMTYMAMGWRDGKIVWFDEYLDKDAALATLAESRSAAGSPDPDVHLEPDERVGKLTELAFAAVVRRLSDSRLERLFGSSRALGAMFKRMEQLFQPAKAVGFSGEIQYELVSHEDVKKWVIRIHDGRATARAGEARAPVTTLRLRLALFVRVAARELHPVKAYREGWLEVEGDFDVAARLSVMFGLSQ